MNWSEIVDNLCHSIESQYSDFESIYHDLHRNPELSNQEEKTANKMKSYLEGLKLNNFNLYTGIGGFGMVGVLSNNEKNNEKCPVILIRAELDALPVGESDELKNSDYRSITHGIMHACGHDLHMTNLLIIAYLLNKHRQLWPNSVILLVCQPAEETLTGGRAMLNDTKFQELINSGKIPKPTHSVAVHVMGGFRAGNILFCKGPTYAAADYLSLDIKGYGGHGAIPHAAKDPIITSAEVIIKLQTLISREVNPIDSAVISIGSIHGGTKNNIIPDSVKLEATIRTFNDSVREYLHKRIHEVVNGIAALNNAPKPEVKITRLVDSIYNDDKICDTMEPIWLESMKKLNSINKTTVQMEKITPFLASDDFVEFGSYFKIPNVMVLIGGQTESSLSHNKIMNHNCQFLPEYKPTLYSCMTALITTIIQIANQ